MCDESLPIHVTSCDFTEDLVLNKQYLTFVLLCCHASFTANSTAQSTRLRH